MKRYTIILFSLALVCLTLVSCNNGKTYRTLLITGQVPADKETSSGAIKEILGETGLFSIDQYTPQANGKDSLRPAPDFAKYALVVLNITSINWPEKTIKAFSEYIDNGGGAVYYLSLPEPVTGTSYTFTASKPHNFEVRNENNAHPVIEGLPVRWVHANDAIIQGFNMQWEKLQVLATAFSDTSFAGSGKREPVIFTSQKGKGRIFVTLLGSPQLAENPSLHCPGFIVTLQRGAEWAASGQVSQETPYDFPTAAGAVTRTGFSPVTVDEAFENIAGYEIGRSTKYYTCIQNSIRKAAGDPAKLASIEKRMVKLLKDPKATLECKKLLLRELSWIGTDYCKTEVKELESVPELKDYSEFTLERLK
jgi:uncharacterized protein